MGSWLQKNKEIKNGIVETSLPLYNDDNNEEVECFNQSI